MKGERLTLRCRNWCVSRHFGHSPTLFQKIFCPLFVPIAICGGEVGAALAACHHTIEESVERRAVPQRAIPRLHPNKIVMNVTDVAFATMALATLGHGIQVGRRSRDHPGGPFKRLSRHRRRPTWLYDDMCQTGKLGKRGNQVHNYGADLRGRSATVSRRHLPGIDRHRANRVAA